MGHPRHVKRGAEVPVPTARQTLLRALPTCAVIVFSTPLVLPDLLPDAEQDDRTLEAYLVFLAAVVLMFIVSRLTCAPRPPRDPEVDTAQRRRALAMAAQTGAVPSDPAVRTATGVWACERIELFAALVAVLLGVLAGALARPELNWWMVWGPVLVGTLVTGFRLRSGLAYLRALHLASLMRTHK